jgi:hypothetical protein
LRSISKPKKRETFDKFTINIEFDALIVLRNNRDLLYVSPDGESIRRDAQTRALARTRGHDRESRATITVKDLTEAIVAAGRTVRLEDYVVTPERNTSKHEADWSDLS